MEIYRRELHHPTTTSGDGGKAQLRIIIPLQSLTDRVGVGVLDSGAEISPSLARMLACDAAIILAVLGSDGQPIDLGRERRLYTGPRPHRPGNPGRRLLLARLPPTRELV